MALSASEQAAIDELNGKKPASASKPSAAPAKKPPLLLPIPGLNTITSIPGEVVEPLKPILTGAARAAGTETTKVFDVLNRASAANQARALRGGKAGAQTFAHSESPEQYQADTAELARQETAPQILPPFGPRLGTAMTKEAYDKMPGWWHQAQELATQIKYDPVTYLGATGVLEHLGEAVATRSFPAFAKAIETMQASANPNMRLAGKGIASAYDFTHFKGETARKLAAASGAEGVHQFRGLKAINNARRTQALDLSRTLLMQYGDVTKGLKPEEEEQLYGAIHGGTVADLPSDLAMRAGKFKEITDQLAHLSGNEELRSYLGEKGFKLPKSMQRFEAQSPRGMQGRSMYREHYVPLAHGSPINNSLEGILKLDQPATADERSLEELLHPSERVEPRTSGINAEDVNLRERGEHAHLLDTDMQHRIIVARLKSGAQALAAHDAEARIAELFGKESFKQVPAAAKQFFEETYTTPGGADFWKGIARGAIDIPKVGLFALPFRHMANIGSLAFLADPSLANVYGTAGKFMRLVLTKDPELRSKILGKAGKYGVTGTPSIDRKAAGWIGQIPGIGELYKASNHVLWTFDDAAKASRFERLLKKYTTEGMDEAHAAYRAADDVSAELIDYSNRSPLTKVLAYVFPFATYRSKFPGAIARSVARHPERTLNLGRRAPELTGDLQQAPPNAQGKSQVGKSYLPLAEALRGADHPMEFIRASSGYPLSMAASALGKAVESAAGVKQPDVAEYMTYGKDPDLKYLLNQTLGSFPGGEFGLGAAGLGEFANQGSLSGTLRSQTGFGITRGPTPTQIQIPKVLEGAQAAADAARKRGDKTTADAIERAMERVQERYRQYVP